MRYRLWPVVPMLAVSCGGTGTNPVAPQPINRPPSILRIELVGYNVAGHGTTLPIRVEVSDPDGDPVTCRYTPDAGRVVADSAGSGCTGTYVAPESGLSDRIGVSAADDKGAATNSSATVALGPQSVPQGAPPPPPNPTPQPPAPQPPPPAPTPSPDPQPTPSPGVNRPPTVTASSAAPGCHPRPGTPCAVQVQAVASDPDGDPITYSWQGCAAGTAASASCAVGTPGPKTATVTVTDSKGASASSTVTVAGTNNAPAVSVTGGGACHPTCTATFSGSAADADGDSVTLAWSGCASGSAPSVTCQVTSPAAVSATLSANDGWVTGTATGTATGANQPPSVACATATGTGGNNSSTVSLSGCTVSGALHEGVMMTITRSDPESDPLTTNWGWSDTWVACSGPSATQVHCSLRVGVDFATITATVSDSFGATRTVNWVLNR